jgi:SAM-dependent methyltransferase
MRSQRTIILWALCMLLSMACAATPPLSQLPSPSAQVPGSADPVAAASARELAQGRLPDVHYVPTPPEVVAEMLRLTNVQKRDVVYDLGSGDGRIVIMAAQKYGARGVGIDIDPERIQEARENAKKAGVTDHVRFVQQDLFEADISEATVVTLYLLGDLNLKLRPKLWRDLKPGTRVVSHTFDMGDWQPEQVVQVGGRTVYYWVMPAKAP